MHTLLFSTHVMGCQMQQSDVKPFASFMPAEVRLRRFGCAILLLLFVAGVAAVTVVAVVVVVVVVVVAVAVVAVVVAVVEVNLSNYFMLDKNYLV